MVISGKIRSIMDYSKKEIAKNKVEYTVTVNGEKMSINHERALHKIGRNAKIAGFRKGHVPERVLEQHLDPTRVADVEINEVVTDSIRELLAKDNLMPLDQPTVSVTKYVPGQELEFTATFDLMPEVKLGDPSKLTTKKPSSEISDKQVDEVIDRLRVNAAEKTAVERAAKNGDEVIIDFTGSVNGKEFAGGTAKNYALKLGSGSFIPGFEDGIVGHKAGEEFDVNVTFPKEYGAPELAGKKSVFKIKLSKVNELKMPELNDEFAKNMAPDLKTVEDLKRDIRNNLAETEMADAEQKYEEALLTEFAAKSKVDVPEVLVNDEIPQMKKRFTEGLMYRGLDLDKYLKQKNLTEEKWVEVELRPAAEKRIRNSMVLTAFIEKEKITVNPEEVIEQQNKMLEQFNNPKVKAHFKTPEYLAQINQQMLTKKALEKLVELAEKGKK